MKNFFLFCLLILAFASCQKSNNSRNPTLRDTIPKNLSTRDTSGPVVSTIISDKSVAHFQYDNKKRLVSEVDSINSYGLSVVNSTFRYDNDDNLIYRKVSGPEGDTVYYITYANGKPVSANYVITLNNLKLPTRIGDIKYTVTNNKVTQIDGGLVYPPNFKMILTYDGDNITSINAPGTFASPVVNYKYGTRKSPFAASKFKWFLFADQLPIIEWIPYKFEYPVTMFSQNVVESFSSPGDPSIKTFANQYDASGNLIKTVISDPIVQGDVVVSVTQTFIVYQYAK